MAGLTTLQLAVLAALFLAVVLAVLAVGNLLAGRVDMRRRLSPDPAGGPVRGPASAGGQAGALKRDDGRSPWARLVARVESLGLSLDDTKAGAVAERLMLAGYPQPHAPRIFVLMRTGLTLLLPLAVFLVLLAGGDLPKPTNLYVILVGSAAAGLYIPNMIVSAKAEERKKAILNGFPDTLDLMLVCIEAGLGIDACFNRVGQEITRSHPLLAELLAFVSLELRAGRSREQALRNLARRTAVPEVTAFVTLIIQADKLGSSIGQALKVYSAEMREARRMRAEEKAHKLPVLMSVPLVVFLLPTMIAVLMLPAAIKMKGTLGGDEPAAEAGR